MVWRFGFDSRDFGTQPVIQVDSAFYPLWDSEMSTGQRAVRLCDWGVKASMACLQAKTVCCHI